MCSGRNFTPCTQDCELLPDSQRRHQNHPFVLCAQLQLRAPSFSFLHAYGLLGGTILNSKFLLNEKAHTDSHSHLDDKNSFASTVSSFAGHKPQASSLHAQKKRSLYSFGKEPYPTTSHHQGSNKDSDKFALFGGQL